MTKIKNSDIKVTVLDDMKDYKMQKTAMDAYNKLLTDDPNGLQEAADAVQYLGLGGIWMGYKLSVVFMYRVMQSGAKLVAPLPNVGVKAYYTE